MTRSCPNWTSVFGPDSGDLKPPRELGGPPSAAGGDRKEGVPTRRKESISPTTFRDDGRVRERH